MVATKSAVSAVRNSNLVHCMCGAHYVTSLSSCPSCKVNNPNFAPPNDDEKNKVYYDVCFAHFQKFVIGDFKIYEFPDWFYNTIRNNFGFIAHYNRQGFAKEYFISTRRKVQFIETILAWQNPHGFAKTVQDWLIENEILEKYTSRLKREIELKEKAEFTRLNAKYGKKEV